MLFNIFATAYPVSQDCSFITFSASDASGGDKVKLYCYCMDMIVANTASTVTGCNDIVSQYTIINYISLAIPVAISISNLLIGVLFKGKNYYNYLLILGCKPTARYSTTTEAYLQNSVKIFFLQLFNTIIYFFLVFLM